MDERARLRERSAGRLPASRLARVQAWATAVWLALIGGAGLGFIARDVLHAGRPAVMLAWTLGAALVAGSFLTGRRRGGRRGAGRPRGAGRCRDGRGGAGRHRGGRGGAGRHQGDHRSKGCSELGQASVEWLAVVLLCSLAFGALAAVGPSIDGRSFGGFLAHRLACAARSGCDDGQRALTGAYGPRVAALVREQAPNLVYERGERQLPVDWRRCRRPECASAEDAPELDVHRSVRGAQATVFTRVLRRARRTYIQYWLYYPESNTTFAGADKAWEASWLLPRIKELVTGSSDWFGFHRDDWETYHVRLDRDGSAWARAGSHGHYQGCRSGRCRNRWIRRTGWTRVSRGSHAGHIPLREGHGRLRPAYPGPDLRERTTTAEGLRLIPLETHDRRRYRRLDENIEPPWRKEAYHDPTSDAS
jgi:hypothetical protein